MVCEGHLYLWDWQSGAETLKKRQAMRHDSLPSLLCVWDKLSEIVSGGVKYFVLGGLEPPSHRIPT
jgi:hypothetical protein